MPPAPCQSVDDVIARMNGLAQTLPTQRGLGPGVVHFNGLYLGVTNGVQQAVGQAGFFDDPQTIARLDVIFAQLYFDAVDTVQAGGEPPDAWKVVFRAADDRAVLPLQFAIAGMNAHINHDLPLALIKLWAELDDRPGTDGPPYADYTKVNQILQAEEARERALVEPAVLEQIDAIDRGAVGRLDGRLAMWTVEAARSAAWHNAGHLWDLRHIPAAQKVVLAAVDRVVAMWGDAFLLPL